jgi:hypothetical protein
MEVSEELFEWLDGAGVVKGNPKSTGQGRFVLDKATSASLENGLAFTPLLKQLN